MCCHILALGIFLNVIDVPSDLLMAIKKKRGRVPLAKKALVKQ
jgi:hypothetical protein